MSYAYTTLCCMSNEQIITVYQEWHATAFIENRQTNGKKNAIRANVKFQNFYRQAENFILKIRSYVCLQC